MPWSSFETNSHCKVFACNTVTLSGVYLQQTHTARSLRATQSYSQVFICNKPILSGLCVQHSHTVKCHSLSTTQTVRSLCAAQSVTLSGVYQSATNLYCQVFACNTVTVLGVYLQQTHTVRSSSATFLQCHADTGSLFSVCNSAELLITIKLELGLCPRLQLTQSYLIIKQI